VPRPTVTNYNRSADDLLGPLIEPYTIVPLGDGRTLAVLSLTDPTHLTVTYPEVASRLLPFWQSLVVTLATLRRLPNPPDVIACVVSSMPLTGADVAAASSKAQAEQQALYRLMNEAIGVDVFILGLFGVLLDTPTPHVRTNWAGDSLFLLPYTSGTVYGRQLENATMTFSEAGRLRGASARSEMIELTCEVEPDEASHRLLNASYEEAEVLLGAPAGTLAVGLLDALRSSAAEGNHHGSGCDGGVQPSSLGGANVCGCRVASCAQGAFVADAIADASNADIGLVNGGSIRAAIPAGLVTEGQLSEMLPFANEVVLMHVSGATLLQALANGIVGLGEPDAATDPAGAFLQVSSSLKFNW
jgi:2',3'-cyclic-nucleotide 2'-phosphodiesterase (5'-nucleotidase family)